MITVDVGEQLAGGWTVYTQWQAIPEVLDATETRQTFPDWAAARHAALTLTCLSGVRYVTLVDPQHVVAADYDRYTKRWRQYALPIGPCGNKPGWPRPAAPAPGGTDAILSDKPRNP